MNSLFKVEIVAIFSGRGSRMLNMVSMTNIEAYRVATLPKTYFM